MTNRHRDRTYLYRVDQVSDLEMVTQGLCTIARAYCSWPFLYYGQFWQWPLYADHGHRTYANDGLVMMTFYDDDKYYYCERSLDWSYLVGKGKIVYTWLVFLICIWCVFDKQKIK